MMLIKEENIDNGSVNMACEASFWGDIEEGYYCDICNIWKRDIIKDTIEHYWSV